MRLFSLRDEIAFVTGAGSGIGQGIAIGLAEAGARCGAYSIVPRAKDLTTRTKRSPKGPTRAEATGDVVGRCVAERGCRKD